MAVHGQVPSWSAAGDRMALTILVLAVLMFPVEGANHASGDSPRDRAAALLARMNVTEKVALCHGYPTTGIYSGFTGLVLPNERLGIPALTPCDGRQGVRISIGPPGNTAWPSALTVVATWDEELMQEFGRGMGAEFYGKGCNVALTPMLILARVPQGGRNFESCGEDPFLASRFGYNEVLGLQSQGVISNADDFVLNNQEVDRFGVTAVANDRTRFEIYYPAYEGAIKAGVGSFMCSYNKINTNLSNPTQPGTFACENEQTLLADLKGALGFDGWVLSDWGGVHDAVPHGNDMEMPSSVYYGDTLLQLVQAGTVPMSTLDDMVLRILTPMYRAGLFDVPMPSANTPLANVTNSEHVALARRLAAAGTVLLKNDRQVLPLRKTVRSIALFGDDADRAPYCCGSGSGYNNPPYIVSPLQGLRTALGASVNLSAMPTPNTAQDLAQVTARARASDVAIVCVSVPSGEGSDRANLSLGTAQDDMVKASLAGNPDTIVVLHNPAAVFLPWADDVAAIVAAFYPGQELGNALADVLLGVVNPSGRLPVTFPMNSSDTPMQTPEQYPGLGYNTSNPYVVYSEELLVGYRWWDATGAIPRFPFGHGLSYTTFEYTDLSITGVICNGSAIDVTVAVENSGGVEGAEVVQLYIVFPEGAGEPPRQLRGFRKVFLQPGEVDLVTFELGVRDVSTWSVASASWAVFPGVFGLFVGPSSRSVLLSGTFVVSSPECVQ